MNKCIYFLILFTFLYCIETVNETNIRVQYFNENNELFYVNAFNDDKGNLYFEFWGEKNNIRYLIGKNIDTEEDLLFNNKKIFSIDSNVLSKYHESIIVDYNNDINIFSFDYLNMNFINLRKESISSKEIIQIIPDIDQNDYFSVRNSLIKLKNNNYLLSLATQNSNSTLEYCQNLNLIIFNFNYDSINDFNLTNNNIQSSNISCNDSDNYINSTECFETENLTIQCFYLNERNEFIILIYDQDLTLLNDTNSFGEFNGNKFAKIFHLKDEIGVYIFFDKNDSLNSEYVPKIFFEELDYSDYILYDLFEIDCNTSLNQGHSFIILNANDSFILDDCLYCSDAIKINESKFVVILTIKDENNLLICLFDVYNNYSSLRLRYYILELSLINVEISINLRTFVFKNYFGLIFYDSNIQYPGYLFFNYPNITSDYKINLTTINIKLFTNSSESYLFNISDNLEILNNIFGGIEKIKILNYPPSNETGILINSFELNSEISLDSILNINDTLIFEKDIDGAIPGNYTLEFIPITIITEESNNSIQTDFYGNGEESDFSDIEVFSNETYKLIYNVECFEKCKTCSQLGNETFYYCVKCLEDNFHSINNGEKCICEDYKYINKEGQNLCLINCDEGLYKYNISENEKYCLASCEFNGEELSKDEVNKICYIKESIDSTIYYSLYSLYENITTDNFCPDDNPFFKIETNECVFKCTIEDLSKYLCYYNNYNNLTNKQAKIFTMIKMELINNFNTAKFDEGGGDIIIKVDDIIYTITSNKIQKNLKNISYNMTVVDLSECELKLIKENRIQKNTNLYILKRDIQDETRKVPKVDYDVYYYPINKTNLALLDLSLCENTRINVIVQINIPQDDIEKYNASSDYYNDICYTFTTESGTDLTLKDRQKQYKGENMDICEEKCEFKEYDHKSGKAICSCLTQTTSSTLEKFELNTTRLYSNFKNVLNLANLELIQCASLIFSTKEMIGNIANYIMVSIFLMNIVVIILFVSKGYREIKILVEEIGKAVKSQKKSEVKNENKIKKKKKTSLKILPNNKNKSRPGLDLVISNITNAHKNNLENRKRIKKRSHTIISKTNHTKTLSNIITSKTNIDKNNENCDSEILAYNDFELNLLNFAEAKKIDERTYCQYYLSLLRNNHLLIFSFYQGDDYNLRFIKIYLFFFTFAMNFTISILFYNYETFHKIYEEEGAFNIIYQIPQIIYSALITGILSSFITTLCLFQNNIITIKRSGSNHIEIVQKRELNNIFCKYIVFFVLNFILLIFFWIYSTSFCLVYKNTQIHLLKDVLMSFSTSLIKPIIIYLLPGIFRIPALKSEKSKKLYMFTFSKLLAML